MNIFILDQDITKNAQAHCNQHVHKMITEGLQILVAAQFNFHMRLSNQELRGLIREENRYFKIVKDGRKTEVVITQAADPEAVDSKSRKINLKEIMCKTKKVYAALLNSACIPSHEHHPSVRWIMESGTNWNYLVSLCEALKTEYCFRYDKDTHASWEKVKTLSKPLFSSHQPTGFMFVDGEAVVGDIDVIVKLTRDRYIVKNTEFKNPMKWGKVGTRETPKWFM